MFYRDIVCFANSIKFNARCIAGKDINSLEWIRPISEASDGELSKEQIKCDNNGEPDLLDIIRIPFKTEKAKYYQPENIVIENIKWQKIGRFQEEKLDDICDRPDTILDNSHPGNKKISLTHLKKCGAESSLLLIKVDSVKVERKNYNEDKKYRAVFFLQWDGI